MFLVAFKTSRETSIAIPEKAIAEIIKTIIDPGPIELNLLSRQFREKTETNKQFEDLVTNEKNYLNKTTKPDLVLSGCPGKL